jgi:CheY-like chemotaxis protein
MRAELSDNAWSEPVTHVRVLVADDDEGVRAPFVSLLGATGIASTLEAEDGAEAVQVGLQLRPEIAVLDLNMPRLSGVEVAQTLRALQPSLRIALRSSDPDDLRARAGGLGLPLFDKLECERLVHWVETQARSCGPCTEEPVAAVSALQRRRDLTCLLCGYGIVSRKPPERCPMCQVDAAWTDSRSRPAQKTAAYHFADSQRKASEPAPGLCPRDLDANVSSKRDCSSPRTERASPGSSATSVPSSQVVVYSPVVKSTLPLRT